MKNACLNVWKGIAAFCVVFIHCKFPSPIGGMMDGLARFAVPLFFMVSGYFSYGKGMDTVKRRSRHILRLLITAVIAYYFWELLLLKTEGSLTMTVVAGKLFSAKVLLRFLLWNMVPYAPPLWFLGALWYCYLFYGILVRGKKEESCYLLIILCLAANLILGDFCRIAGLRLPVRWFRNFWLTGLPFFLWGHWFAGRMQRGKRLASDGACLCMIGLGVCLSMGELFLSKGAELYVGSILMTAGIFMLALRHPEAGRGSILARIGEQDSQAIYLWHYLIYNGTPTLALAAGIRETAWYPWLMPLWVCLVSLGLAEMLNALKYRAKRGE